jgi:hypothetical protein
MYHFGTREELLMAIQRHLTETWEQYLLTELGKPLEESTAQERAAIPAETSKAVTTAAAARRPFTDMRVRS